MFYIIKYSTQYPNGATVTVFAPYDCNNHCPFCVNKKDYITNPHFDLHKVKGMIAKVSDITPNCDFVITGGEPCADLNKLEELLFQIYGKNFYAGHHHKIFINTTLPPEQPVTFFLNRWAKAITGINVSRHIKPYVKECDDEIFDLLDVPVRINTVIYKPEEAELIKEHCLRFAFRKSITGLQIREDYTTATEENLFEIADDSIFATVCRTFNQNPHDIPIFKNTFRWNCEIAPHISYHRTLPYSTIGNQVNDIIITPQGRVLDDWNEYGTDLDLDTYAKLFRRDK